MPIYEYECGDCGHQFEAMRKVSAAPLIECPECGKDSLQKLISKVAFRLKGTGWYETDFKDKPKSDDGNDKEKPKKESAEKKDTAATDTKSASTPESTKKSTAKSDD